MKALEIDVSGIEENGVIADIGNNLKLDLIYNNKDNYIYVSVLDASENRLSGFFRLVPTIDYFKLIRNNLNYQLRCLKINDYAEEKDKITTFNLNKDYKFFLIGEEDD